eukprot:757140-Hanusia_phi.AAC.1
MSKSPGERRGSDREDRDLAVASTATPGAWEVVASGAASSCIPSARKDRRESIKREVLALTPPRPPDDTSALPCC